MVLGVGSGVNPHSLHMLLSSQRAKKACIYGTSDHFPLPAAKQIQLQNLIVLYTSLGARPLHQGVCIEVRLVCRRSSASFSESGDQNAPSSSVYTSAGRLTLGLARLFPSGRESRNRHPAPDSLLPLSGHPPLTAGRQDEQQFIPSGLLDSSRSFTRMTVSLLIPYFPLVKGCRASILMGLYWCCHSLLTLGVLTQAGILCSCAPTWNTKARSWWQISSVQCSNICLIHNSTRDQGFLFQLDSDLHQSEGLPSPGETSQTLKGIGQFESY